MFEAKSRLGARFGAVAAAACTVACAAAIAVPMSAYADEVDDKMAEAESALQSLNSMMAQLDQATADYEAAAAQQQEAEQKVSDAQATIDEKNAEIDNLQGQLGTRARSMYRSGASTFLDVLLGSSSFEEFSTNWDLLNTLNDNDVQMVDEIKDARVEVEDAKATYEKESAKAAEAAQVAAEAQAAAADQVAAMQATYDSLSAEASQLLAARTASQEATAAAAAAQQQETVTADQIVSYDESTGTATLSDGSTAYVTSYDAATGNAIVDRARAALGSAYSWGGVGANGGGYDCSGLVSWALSGSHTRLGTTGTFIGWNRVDDPQPGDVCVIHNGSNQHTGIYVGNGKMIHASDYGTGVIESDVQDGMVYVRP